MFPLTTVMAGPGLMLWKMAMCGTSSARMMLKRLAAVRNVLAMRRIPELVNLVSLPSVAGLKWTLALRRKAATWDLWSLVVGICRVRVWRVLRRRGRSSRWVGNLVLL